MKHRRFASRVRLIGQAAAAITLLAASPAHADRMVLWTLVHDQCVVHLKAGVAPKPCDSVDIAAGEDSGVALLKDRVGVAQMLAISTRRVSGIEDPLLLEPDAPNYFAAAWAARANVEAHLGRALPREAVALAINSQVTRSQDQFHIHVDCVKTEVAEALRGYLGSLDATWRVMTVPLGGRYYWARRVDSTDLSDVAPFRDLADGVEGAKAHMGLWSLAAVGATFAGRPGFVLLADHAELDGGGSAETLQDHACAIAPAKS